MKERRKYSGLNWFDHVLTSHVIEFRTLVTADYSTTTILNKVLSLFRAEMAILTNHKYL